MAKNALSGLASSGPIVVDGRSGVKITGLKISNSGGPCILVRNGASNIEISGNEIGPCSGDAVEVLGSNNVTVKGNNIADAQQTGIKVQDSSNINVVANFVDKAATAYRAVRSSRVTIDLNAAINIRGNFPDGQLAQLDNVTGAGNRVRCNATDLSIGGPDPASTFATPSVRTEDMINTWQSNGDGNDPILIAYNRLKGGGSLTGSGIMSGDGGGSNISVIGNRIVNPWNAGIGVAGGQNIRIERNRVFSNMPAHIANEGFYVRNFTSEKACTNIVHQNNEIKWPATDFSTSGWTQTYWQPPSECSNVTGNSTNNLNANLTAAIFSEPIAECKALANGMGFASTGW